MRSFVERLREIEVTPHLAQNTSNRRSAIDGRTTRHAGYATNQRVRVEEVFGWMKTVGRMRQTRHRGVAPVYNLMRLRNLEAAT